ncbi:maestro heat-like repeat-containing protein family member 2A [Chrysemys picta bellii]|uniref:maestro heat-like repeat-containing protein family member 2A n=1 Tax=Chrysemys picta bellii TaxID=8478 RepID=UPI0032B2C140
MDDQDKGKIALRIALIAETELASVVTVLLEKLQQDVQNRADIYCVLEKVLQQDTGGLERRLLNKIITLASNHMRETQEATNELKLAVSNTLVTLARCYFHEVMCELQCHLKTLDEFIFITLGNLSSAYGMLKQAIIKALGPMMSLLLHKEEHHDRVFELISWVLEQYKEDIDVFHITKSLSQLLKVSFENKIPLPKRKFQAICSALHNQICSQAKPLSTENHAELLDCVVLGFLVTSFVRYGKNKSSVVSEDVICSLAARSSPDDLIAFLHSQLEIENEAVRVASLNLLSAIVGADLPETRVKKFLIVKAVKSTLSDQNAKVRKAVLHFIRRLLSSGSVENCAAWDMVAYVFREFSVSTSKLAIQEESTIQTLCIDILQCLDTSVSGMTQVLWPRLLEYVVPAQYTGTLKPLCRCLRELAEKKQQEGEEAACLDYSGRVKLPTPQGLLARLLVVASSPYEREGYGYAALQLLKALHHIIHAAVDEMWVVKIPPLLQYIEVRENSGELKLGFWALTFPSPG